MNPFLLKAMNDGAGTFAGTERLRSARMDRAA
jgi:hypothetical protein